MCVTEASKSKNPKGKGKGNWKGKSKIVPKQWCQMSRNEQWWLCQLESGKLQRRVEQAEAKMHPVQARPFSLG